MAGARSALLFPLAVRDVPHDGVDPGSVGGRRRAPFEPPIRTVLMSEPILEMDDRLARDDLSLSLAVRRLDIGRVDEVDEGQGAQLGDVVAECGRPRRVESGRNIRRRWRSPEGPRSRRRIDRVLRARLGGSVPSPGRCGRSSRSRWRARRRASQRPGIRCLECSGPEPPPKEGRAAHDDGGCAGDRRQILCATSPSILRGRDGARRAKYGRRHVLYLPAVEPSCMNDGAASNIGSRRRISCEVVPEPRFELERPEGPRSLSPLRLPVPPLQREG